jgi:hypothetical protein
MIEALTERPGIMVIVDAAGKRHVVSVYTLGRAQAQGASTTYVTNRHGSGLFVRAPIEQVTAEMRRARKLRKDQKSLWASAQLPLDFGDTHQTEKADVNIGPSPNPSSSKERDS